MSTRERMHSLIDLLSPEDIEIIFPVLERLVSEEQAEEVPNAETIEAMLETERIAYDPNTKKYSSFREFMKDMEQEDNEKI